MKLKIIFLSIICFFFMTGANARPTDEELLKIANSHRPQPSNSVAIGTNLFFFVSSDSYDLFPANHFKSNEELCWCLLGANTNHIWYRHFPAKNFDFHLFDENGEEIPKSKAGLDFAGTPKKPTIDDIAHTGKYVGYSVTDMQGECRKLFRPNDMFVLTNNGVYELQIQIYLCVIMTNGVPDSGAMLDARNVTGHGLHSLPFAESFGVLSSPLLRVRVVKNE